MGFIRFIVLLLIVAGALNWGLWGFFQYDLIQDIVGSDTSFLARAIYAIIGLAGIWGISFFFRSCLYRSTCKSKEGQE